MGGALKNEIPYWRSSAANKVLLYKRDKGD